MPLAEQDRSRWDRALIAEGVALVSAALPKGAVGEYQFRTAAGRTTSVAERIYLLTRAARLAAVTR